MADVLACVDRSAYANSVCDHAGWFASDPDVGVEVLHVTAPPGGPSGLPAGGDPLVERAVWRLLDEGVGPVTSALVTGDFVEVASKYPADVIVMGKRGEASDAGRLRLGSSVDPMVRATMTPICLTSKVFLPIHRALILLDADMDHRTAIEFAITHERLDKIPKDVVVIDDLSQTADAKVEWARSELGDNTGDVFALQADGLDEAVIKYMESRGAHLIVVSRAVIASDPEARLRRIEERGLWGMRTPVLIC